MAVEFYNRGMIGWVPADQGHPPGTTISTITTPTYDRQGGSVRITVTRFHPDPDPARRGTVVLHDGTDTTSVGFGAQVLTIGAPVTNAEPISISIDFSGPFSIDLPSGAINYV